MVLLLGAYYILIPLILSKLKKKIDGKIIRFSFNEECFKVSENDEEREVSYSTVNRVGKNGEDVYLFTDNVITFIVDTSALSYEELENLRLILKSKFISKYFKSNLDIGLIRYINILRLKNAIKLMLTKQYNITQCAMESGFNTLRTFYRVFSEEFSCTPKEYLKKSQTL